MLKIPSRKRTKKSKDERLNLIPILDSVFIFIFFLLMSVNFIQLYEINSDVPMLSSKKPPEDKKPLALTLTIRENNIAIATGLPSTVRKTINKLADGSYDLVDLHDYLISLKNQFPQEKDAIIEPLIDVTYEDLVKIMDAVRLFNKTDPEIFTKDANGLQQKMEELFNNIIFGNIQS